MIKRLQIKNFMSIHQAKLELGRINVFIGKSDAGKSTVLRAIDALHTNQYPAVRFATHGETSYSVAEVTDSGVAQIQKSKTTAFKTLQVIGGQQVEHTYNAAGRDIPLPVKQIINQPIFELDPETSLDVLYAGQHKPFFLIQEDKTTFTKVISKVANAERIKTLETLVDGDIRSNKKRVTTLKGQIVDYDNSIAVKEVQLEALKPFASLKQLTDSTRLDHEAAEQTIKTYTDLSTAKGDVIRLSTLLSTLKPLDVPDTSTLDKLAEASALIRLAGEALPNTLEATFDTTEKLGEAAKQLTVASLALPDKIEVSTQASVIAEARGYIKELNSYTKDLAALQDEKDQLDAQLDSLVGQTCPICGNPITKESLENV